MRNRQRRVLDKVVRGGLVVGVEEKGDVATVEHRFARRQTGADDDGSETKEDGHLLGLQLLEVLGRASGDAGRLIRGLREVGHG